MEEEIIKVELCRSLVSRLHVCTCSQLLMHICMQVSVHAHPRTCTHAHSCRLPHPLETDLCLAPVLHPPLSLLISGTAEEVLQETTPTARSATTWPACLGYFQPPPAWPQDAAQSEKKESRGP